MLTILETLPYRLHDSMGYQLSLTARIIEKGFEDRLKQLALTRLTWCILLAVQVEGLQNPSDIAAFVGVERSAISRALRAMEGAELIRRQAGRDDGRTTKVQITEKGAGLCIEATPMAQENAARFAGKLADEERQTLARLLGKLRADETRPLPRL